MGRRGLRIGIGIGPVGVSGRVGGRGRRRQYRPGVHPLKQDNLRYMFREMRRRKAGGR
jgi:hypothetical protein